MSDVLSLQQRTQVVVVTDDAADDENDDDAEGNGSTTEKLVASAPRCVTALARLVLDPRLLINGLAEILQSMRIGETRHTHCRVSGRAV